MAKKFKKTAKEINRLANLYQKPMSADNSRPGAGVPISPETGKTTIQTLEQVAIRHDLINLLVIDVIVLAVMFLLNYLIDQTALGGVLTNFIARII